MEKRYDLLTLGEVMMRLSPPANEKLSRGDSLQKTVGGSEFNIAAGAALLGLRTGFLSVLPDNGLGDYVRNQIHACRVDDTYVLYDRRPEARLGLYFYETAASPRKPGVVYDRKNSSFTAFSFEDYPEELYGQARCFHTSGITLALGEKSRDTAISMMKKFKEQGALISFDVNFRGNLWTGEEARACIEEILPLVDIFFCSEDTARLTFHKEGTAKEIMKSFTEEYPISIVVATQRIVHSPKRHTFGSVLYAAKEDAFYEEEPYRDVEVVDRIGSGDAYVSGVLYGLLAHDFSCQTALEYGNAAGAAKITIPGDLPASDRKEIDSLIKAHKGIGLQTEMNR